MSRTRRPVETQSVSGTTLDGLTSVASPIESSRVIPTSEFMSTGDGGLPGGGAFLLRCSAGEYAACTIMSQIGRAGESAPARGTRALPHIQADVDPPLNGKRRAPFNVDGDLRIGIVVEKRNLREATASEYAYRCNEILLDVAYTPTHKRRTTCVQAALAETDRLLPLLKHAGAATKLARDRCPSTSANTKSLLSR